MIVAFFDGSGTGGHEFVYFGYRIFKNGTLYTEGSGREAANPTSNNVAEYAGFIKVLRLLLEDDLQGEEIVIFSDSQLVINQMFHGWRIRGGAYESRARAAIELRKSFPKLTGEWRPREQMKHVDSLARELWEEAKVKQITSKS